MNLSKMSTSDRNPDLLNSLSPNSTIAPPRIIGMTNQSPPAQIIATNKFNWNFNNDGE